MFISLSRGSNRIFLTLNIMHEEKNGYLTSTLRKSIHEYGKKTQMARTWLEHTNRQYMARTQKNHTKHIQKNGLTNGSVLKSNSWWLNPFSMLTKPFSFPVAGPGAANVDDEQKLAIHRNIHQYCRLTFNNKVWASIYRNSQLFRSEMYLQHYQFLGGWYEATHGFIWCTWSSNRFRGNRGRLSLSQVLLHSVHLCPWKTLGLHDEGHIAISPALTHSAAWAVGFPNS